MLQQALKTVCRVEQDTAQYPARVGFKILKDLKANLSPAKGQFINLDSDNSISAYCICGY
jgi:hypothetical protein